MKKEQARRWLHEWLKHQQQVTKFSMLGLAGLAGVAWLLELGLVTLIVRIGFVGSFSMAFLFSGGILGVVQWLTLRRLPDNLGDREVSGAEPGDGEVRYRLAQGLPAVWTYAFGNMDTDLSWQEKLVGVLCMPQRLAAAAVFANRRQLELQRVNIEVCAAVIRQLYRAAERVEISKLADELQLRDSVAVIRDVSLVDGVLLLTRRTAGLSLAGRLVENIGEWLQRDGGSGGADRS
ncbi:MAG: hypothetical protein ACKPJD_05825 [Planctomycetaceae bacterium]